MVIITRPNHDLATTYLYYFSEEVVKYCKNKSIGLVDLKANKANKKLFDSYVKSKKNDFIFVNGHGDSDCVTGFNNELLIDKYEKEFKNTIIYCRSCKAGEKLGNDLVTGGARAFIGYNKNYFVLHSTKRLTNPLTDKVARLFLEPSNLIAMSIIKGNEVGEANRKSINLLKKNIMNVASSTMGQKDEVISYLVHNLKCQVVIGDHSARI